MALRITLIAMPIVLMLASCQGSDTSALSAKLRESSQAIDNASRAGLESTNLPQQPFVQTAENVGQLSAQEIIFPRSHAMQEKVSESDRLSYLSRYQDSLDYFHESRALRDETSIPRTLVGPMNTEPPTVESSQPATQHQD